MPLIESCLTILGAITGITGLHSWFTGLKAGGQMDMILAEQNRLHSEVKRLSDRILYTPTVQQVQTINESSKRLSDLRDLRQFLEPVQQGLNTEILSTAVLSTPSKLQAAFGRDPFEVLIETRPINRAKVPANSDLLPILFFDNGVHYIGWQTRGALPILFGCDYSPGMMEPEVHFSDEWVKITAGQFLMGSPENEAHRFNNEILHRVRITRPFLMKRTLITVGEYRSFRSLDAHDQQKGDDHPIMAENWFDAVAYCNWRSEQEGFRLCYRFEGENVTWDREATGYRLPTEAADYYPCLTPGDGFRRKFLSVTGSYS